jgi:DNA-binding transcriptional MerR regulator
MPETSTRRRTAARATAELTVGQLAQLADMSPDGVRFYERRGLLAPARRTSAGYRLFDPSAIDRLDFIRKAQALGLSLDQVGEVLRAATGGAAPCEHVRAALETHLRKVDARLRDLRALRATLADALRHSTEVSKQGSCICGIIESQELPRRASPRRRREDQQ